MVAPNFSEVANGMLGSGKNMSDDLKIDSKVKEKAISLLDEARDMLDKEGVDGTQFIMNHLGGERASVEAAKDPDKDRKKNLLILALKGKNGESDEE